MKFHPARLNVIKRDGGAWTREQIDDLVDGVVDGSLCDAQLGALLMAVCCRGMDAEETVRLTLAMRDSGSVLDLSSIRGAKVDKHSTGGVGDKVSLALAPLVAACGVPVPMISGRGLGHTGGTIDKLGAIPGYRTDLTPAEFVAVLRDCGFVMGEATASIAPADRRMYATRDITGTISSVPLITASILSKKLAEGLDALVMDVKVGRAAFMKDAAQARELAESLVRVGRAAGVEVIVLLTDMDAPLGRTIGNRLEVLEAVQLLQGQGAGDLREVTWALGIEMLLLGGVAPDVTAARSQLDRAVADGSALDALRRNIARQGGDPAFVDDPGRLGEAPVTLGVVSPHPGYVQGVDPLALGRCAMDLGAGRRQPTDVIDPQVGIVLNVQVGDRVERGEPLALVHARTQDEADLALTGVLDAFSIGDRPPPPRSIILDRIGGR